MPEKTMDLARGQWRTILAKLGVDKKYLTGRNVPCPACGGRDRFRFHDRRKDGDYYCNQCGAGKGLSLLMKIHGWPYATAANEVDKLLGYRFNANENPHKHCCSTPEEECAHRAAIAFFAKQPDFAEQTTTQILMDESLSFDEAMELIAERQLRGINGSTGEPVKSLRDAALWLRRYRPNKLEAWLDRHDPLVRRWLNEQP